MSSAHDKLCAWCVCLLQSTYELGYGCFGEEVVALEIALTRQLVGNGRARVGVREPPLEELDVGVSQAIARRR
jgi:hypothetical protein